MKDKFWMMAICVLAVGCAESGSDEAIVADSDSGVDLYSDVDTVTEQTDPTDPTDSDSVGDTNTAADTDSDTDSDSEPGGDSASDSGADTASDSETGADPCEAPEGYTVEYCLDYETTLKAADYMNDDVWWFYDGGSATDWSNPELDKRFIISPDPISAGNRALQIIKFTDDEDTFNQNLNPRAELSLRPSEEHSASTELIYRMNTYFPAEQAGVFSAEFTQFWLHGSENIPLQLEVRDGVFRARRPGKTPVVLTGSASLAENTGRWIAWEVQAKFNRNGGYWRVYKDGVLAYEQAGDMGDWPDDGGTWHTQYGAYANNGGEGTMVIYFDDYLIAVK